MDGSSAGKLTHKVGVRPGSFRLFKLGVLVHACAYGKRQGPSPQRNAYPSQSMFLHEVQGLHRCKFRKEDLKHAAGIEKHKSQRPGMEVDLDM